MIGLYSLILNLMCFDFGIDLGFWILNFLVGLRFMGALLVGALLEWVYLMFGF